VDHEGLAWEGSATSLQPAAAQHGLPVRAWGIGCALLAAAVVGGVLLVNSGGSAPSTPVSLAAYTSTQQLGYRFKLAVSASANGFNLAISGAGAINIRPSVSGSMSVSVLGRTVDEIFSGSSIYLQSGPASWTRTTLPAYAQSSGLSQNPASTLDYLRAAGTVSDLGPDTVDGVATVRYQALVDLNRLASLEPGGQNAQTIATIEQATGSSTLPIDAWIDSSHLVRRLSLSLPITRDGVTIDESVTIDFLSYGAQAAPSPPPADEVTDASPPGA
jgi:hypothetical protein